jgi:MFS family permease
LVLAIGALLVNFGLYVPYYYVEPFVATIGASDSMKGYLLPLINGSSFVGRVLGGYIADKVGRLNLLYPLTLLSGIFCFAIWLPARNVNPVIVFTCLYGFGTGVFISITSAVVTQITPKAKLGARLGAFHSILAIATLTGNPIAGVLIRDEANGGYKYLISFAVSRRTLPNSLFSSPKTLIILTYRVVRLFLVA